MDSNEETSPNDIRVVMVHLKNLSENVIRMRASLEKMESDTQKIAVFEERHTTQSDAIHRAFRGIKELDLRIDNEVTIAQKSHKVYDRWIYGMAGAMFAISIMWTVFGVMMLDTARGVVAAESRMDQHIAVDKITNSEDVRKVIKEQK